MINKPALHEATNLYSLHLNSNMCSFDVVLIRHVSNRFWFTITISAFGRLLACRLFRFAVSTTVRRYLHGIKVNTKTLISICLYRPQTLCLMSLRPGPRCRLCVRSMDVPCTGHPNCNALKVSWRTEQLMCVGELCNNFCLRHCLIAYVVS